MSEHVKANEVEVSVDKTLSKMRKNPWVAATIVLAIALIVVIIIVSMNSSSGGVGAAKAGQNLISFVNAQGNGEATYVSGVTEGSLYKITVKYNDEDIPVYVTLDGKYLISSPIPLTLDVTDTKTPAAKEVPKTDKPVADFYVFSYCPYGTQVEKALVPVYNLLKDKADINIVFIGAMHDPQGCSGAACFEKTESLRQLCIQKNYGKDKLFAYLDKLLVNAAVGNCQGKDTCVNPLIESIYTQVGIDKAKINTCITNDAEALYAADEAKARSLGIGGSPTIVINGVQTQPSSRSPAAIQKSICSAFNTAPAECEQALSTAAASAGFGSTASSSSSASCG